MLTRDTPWFRALAPYVDRDDLVVELAHPFLTASGERVDAVPSISVRLPMWTAAPFVDDLGKKTAAMVDLDGEHLFAELALLRLLERDGWQGRWIHTNAGGEITRYLTEWRDVSRQEQKNRPIQHDAARATLYAIADRSGNRFAGLWPVIAWREQDIMFFELKRQPPKDRERLKPAQEAWVRAACTLRQNALAARNFALVQWEYRSAG